MSQRTAVRGLRTFMIFWIGQVISVAGSGLTAFGLGVWVYQRTGSVTQYALISLFAVLPDIVMAPLAGALVDRWDRRRVMIVGDLAAGLCTVAVALLLAFDRLQIWQIYIAAMAIATCNTFQRPAYLSSISLLVPKEQLGRANGLVQAGQAAAQLLAPALAGVLILTIQLQGVILIDFITFLISMFTLLSIRIPMPETSSEERHGQGSFLREAMYGWAYLAARPGLLALLLLAAVSNLLLGIVSVLVTPLVLAFASATALGTLLSVGGFGMLLGSLSMSAWGGPKRRIDGVLGFMLIGSLFIVLGGVRPSLTLCMVAAFGFFFCLPISNGCSQAILQRKVVPDVQGRVFAATGMITSAFFPLSFLIAGPLADRIFEPLLASGGPLAGSIGHLIGVGPGRGIGLMFIIVGTLTALIAVAAYLYPYLRLVDSELPDMIADASAVPERAAPDFAAHSGI